MEKRVFLAIVLMFVVLAVYDYYLPKLSPPETAAPAPVGAANTPAQTTAPATSTTPTPSAPAATAAPAPLVKPLVADKQEREIVVDTDNVRAVFSSAGGTLRSWTLKRYPDAEGKPFEVVPVDLPPTLPRPFTLAT